MFPIDKKKLKSKFGRSQKIVPVELFNATEHATTFEEIEKYLLGRTAVVYGFSSGRPLSRSAGVFEHAKEDALKR